jgi:hypothetical protein
VVCHPDQDTLQPQGGFKMSNPLEASLKEQQKFLTNWPCVCGTCLICIACLEVAYKIIEGEEEE